MFNSTNEAIAQGMTADPARKFFHYGLRRRFEQMTHEALDLNRFDLASMFACQAQFCREFYDAENVKVQADRIFSKMK